MTESVLTALVTGGLSLLGVIVTNLAAAERTRESIRTAQAVTDTKLETLTSEVRRHNSFAEKIPRHEAQMREIERRIGALERIDREEEQCRSNF